MKSRVQVLEERIGRTKTKLSRLGELRPGVLSEQYNVCGNPGCRCKANPPEKHGPYQQLSWSRKRKSRTRFIRQSDLRTVRAQISNYQRLQELVGEWIDASIELCDIKRKLEREK
jgi:hypothetical protein